MIFHSHSLEENKLEMFTIFLNRTIEGNTLYISELRNILDDVHKLLTGEKNLYQIDNNNFPLVILLKNLDPEYFRSLDVSNIDKDDYKKILTTVQSDWDDPLHGS